MYFFKKLKEKKVCYANIHIYYAWQFSFHLEDLIFHLVFPYSLSTSCSEDLLATNSLVFVYLKMSLLHLYLWRILSLVDRFLCLFVAVLLPDLGGVPLTSGYNFLFCFLSFKICFKEKSAIIHTVLPSVWCLIFHWLLSRFFCLLFPAVWLWCTWWFSYSCLYIYLT